MQKQVDTIRGKIESVEAMITQKEAELDMEKEKTT